ncbi:ATP-dependent DNA ligase [Chitinispirillum alkaliphilum]|nr:ATP-dependent DNA ligase [Chitinispirillum alkaliphilum]
MKQDYYPEETDNNSAAKSNQKHRGAVQKLHPDVYTLGAKVQFKGPLRPMLPVLVETPFDRRGWLFEIKWDGYRAIAECLGDKTELYSRNGKSFLSHYPTIVKELKELDFEAVFDGEIVVIDENGRSDFSRLQNYRRTGAGTVIYYIFDLIYFRGYDITGLPLRTRKALLQSILPRSLQFIKFSNHLEEQGKAFFNTAQKFGVEGIVGKDGASPYIPGTRSRRWQKIKFTQQQEMVIGGYTVQDKTEELLSSLITGVYESGNLIYTGNVGSGFSHDELAEIPQKLSKYSKESSPFSNPPAFDSNTRWIAPEPVAVVRFSEWTKDNIMRHPVFLGFREDAEAGNVKLERAEKSVQRYNIKTDETKICIDDILITITNSKKVYFPHDNVSKGEVIEYYRQIAPWILPHLRGRPQSLHRFPDGIRGKDFYHKNIEITPSWITTEEIGSDDSEEKIRYILCQNEASLVYMVNLGALEINPWLSRVGNLDNPDYMVIDLDPVECPFSEVVRVALEFHSILNRISAPNYVKTSGATGLHIFVPLNGAYNYAQVRQFAMLLAHTVNTQLPATTSIERSPARRVGKVYLDYLQNIKGKTIASVYSLRPRDMAPVSMPLSWDEVNESLNPNQFTIKTALQRLQAKGDLWRPVLGEGISMENCLRRLGKILFDTGG